MQPRSKGNSVRSHLEENFRGCGLKHHLAALSAMAHHVTRDATTAGRGQGLQQLEAGKRAPRLVTHRARPQEGEAAYGRLAGEEPTIPLGQSSKQQWSHHHAI